MIKLALIFIISFLSSLVLTNPIKKFAVLLGAVDMPQERKIHTAPTPRMGGLAIFVAFLLGFLPIFGFTPTLSAALVCGGALTVAVGISDDVFSIRPITKLLLQSLTAATACLIGVRIDAVTLRGSSYVLTPPVSFGVTVFFIVLLMNAMNFIDGMDALSAGMAIVSLFAMLIIGRRMHGGAVFAVTALIGSLIGFLPHNIHPASVFMGDTGSMTLGYFLACMYIRTYSGIASASSLLIFAVPVFDVFFAVMRRIIAGKNPFAADRGHIHHILYDNGIPEDVTVLLLLLVASCFATVSIMAEIM